MKKRRYTDDTWAKLRAGRKDPDPRRESIPLAV
jgi:hypothetical protein